MDHPNFPLSVLPAVLFSSLGGVDGGIFHRVTMTSMTGNWYLPITHSQAIIVGLVILEIFIFRYLQILPLNFSKLIESGVLLQTVVSKKKRKKRQTTMKTELDRSLQVLEKLLTVTKLVKK